VPGPSAIEWTEATWNPVTGCDKVSPGCAHCYAETFAERWRGIPGHPYEQGFALKLWPQRLEQPLEWSRPRMTFVNSMSDLFHEQIPESFIRPKGGWPRPKRRSCCTRLPSRPLSNGQPPLHGSMSKICASCARRLNGQALIRSCSLNSIWGLKASGAGLSACRRGARPATGRAR